MARGRNVCGKCEKPCAKNVKGDERSAQCILCEYWFHLKCIPGMNPDYLDNIHLAQDAIGTRFWACDLCKSFAANLIKRQTSSEKRIEVLESNLLDCLKTIDRQNNTIAELEKKVAEGNKVVEKCKDDATAAVRAEISELDERKSNLVVYGLPESAAADAEAKMAEDNVKVTEIVEAVEAADCKFAVKHRAGKPMPDKVRPLIISFDTPQMRDKVILNAKKLSGKDKFKKVYLAPDLTKRQREDDAAKEAELKAEANAKNEDLSDEEKNSFEYRVVGPRGKRRIGKWWTRRRGEPIQVPIPTA